MKLLILTQTIDRTDSSLGFFQKWVSTLATKFEEIEVICLKEGEHELPSNVRVHSLGKEEAGSSKFFNKILYILRFYRLIWHLRNKHDTVFVHMNQEYLLLGGVFWRLLGKKIFMWRNHYDGSVLTDIAVMFCHKVFCTSKFSYTARFKKTTLMPVGVDVDSCRLDEQITRVPRTILSLGRLDSSKRPEVLIDALSLLKEKGIDFNTTFVGGPSKTDSGYPEKLRMRVESLNLINNVTFVGAVPNTETFRYYRSSDIFVNCSRSGMFDKTIFEAVACGCLVLATSRDFKDLVGEEFIFDDGDSAMLANKLAGFLKASSNERSRLLGTLNKCIQDNRLSTLSSRLAKELEYKK